ncbi:hypothetical protein pipiens_003693 [Culex pipiens pipiens]|uniref:Odorant receptor n=1 Tax=Culex pipiens pipiens TaxID=38569 RepID=A0ABD1CTZ6_CULPP
MAKTKVAFNNPQPVKPLPTSVLKFDSFIQLLRIIGTVCGAVNYDEQHLAKPSRWIKFKRIFFWFTYVHDLLCIALEVAYFVEAVQRMASLAHLMVLVVCIGFLTYTIIKLTMHKLHEVELNEILIQLKDLYPETLDTKPAEEYRRHIWFLKLFSVLYVVVLVVFNVIFYAPSITVLIKTGHWEKILPFYLKYWYDWRKPVVFELTFLHQIWVSSSAVTGVLLADTLYCTIILLISMQFELLGKRLEESELDEPELVKCVEKHLLLIDVCARFERIYSPSLLVTFVGSSGVICCCLFLTLAGENMGEAVRFSLLLFVYIMNIFLLCYYGSVLMEKSSNIAHHVDQSQWYNNCKKDQKTLLMILIRGQQEEKMTALKFTTVSLPCFSGILSTAFSYFTLLKAVYEGS